MAQILSNIDMDVNINILRKRSASSNQVSSRKLLTHSAASSTSYHKKIEIQNNLLNKDEQKAVKVFELSYILDNE